MNQDDEEDQLRPPEEGIEVDIPGVSSDIEEMDDGSALVDLHEKGPKERGKFYANLAEDMDEGELHTLGEDLLELLERDQESRKRRDDAYEEGLRLSGVDRESSIGASFDGASRAVHPVLAEAAVDFASRAIKELFPSAGPVKSQIIGKVTDEKLDKAERKKGYMNWQLTKQMPEYRGELEQLLTQLALAGSQFSKVYRDTDDDRNRFEFIPSDQVILPFSATSFETAKRKAQILDLTELSVERRIESGLYIDFCTESASLQLEQTDTKTTAELIEGKEQTGYNEDGLRRLYEIYVWLEIADDTIAGDRTTPYIVTVDDYSRKVISIYRNWREDDDHFKEIEWIVEWPFIPWRGSLTIGLVSFIGSLAIAATGSLNALLDSAHVNNTPTAVALKGSKVTGSTVQVEPTTVTQIEGPAGMDDIRKLMMPMPYNQPSPVLFQLLGWLTDAAKGVISTASEKLADASNMGPVGTTYALIEQGAQVFSAIHMRLHAAQAKVLNIIHRLNAEFLEDRVTVEELGELVVSRVDFEGPMDIAPVSDPNIFSEVQRWSQLQEAFKLSQDQRVKYDVYKLHERALQLLRFPQIEEVLPKPPEPVQTNPVAENVNASKGMSLFVFPDEDHVAHLQVHLPFVTDPAFQMIAASAVAPLMGHVTQHLSYLYAHIATTLASEAAGHDIAEFMVDTKLSRQVDGLLAAAAPHVHEIYAQQVEPFKQQLMQLAQAAQQQAQAASQNVPLDPASAVAKEVGMAEIQRKTQADQQTLQLKQAELQASTQAEQQKSQLTLVSSQQKSQSDQQKQVTDADRGRVELEAKGQLEMLKAHLSMEIERMKLEQKASTDLMLAHLHAIVDLEKAELSAKTTLAQSQVDAANVSVDMASDQARLEGDAGV